MRNWADIPHDLLVLVASRVNFIEDFISFREVCNSWRLAATSDNFRGSSPQVPWLMIRNDEDEDDDTKFISVRTGIIFSRRLLPELKGKRCINLLGWILTVGQKSELALFNPFSSVQLKLPSPCPTTCIDRYCIRKAAMSSGSSSNFAIAVSYNCRNHLAIWKLGDTSWTQVGDAQVEYYYYDDVTWYQERFYAILNCGAIVHFDVANPTLRNTNVINTLPIGPFGWWQFYIMGSEGGLLIVKRVLEQVVNVLGLSIEYKTKCFHAYQLDLVVRGYKRIEDLEGATVFLGDSACVLVDSSNFPGIKPNCVCFSEDGVDDYAQVRIPVVDMGIYSLKDGFMQPFHGIEVEPGFCSAWATLVL